MSIAVCYCRDNLIYWFDDALNSIMQADLSTGNNPIEVYTYPGFVIGEWLCQTLAMIQDFGGNGSLPLFFFTVSTAPG